MSNRNWGDRGALVALALLLSCVVLAALIQRVGTDQASYRQGEEHYAAVAAANPDDELYRRCEALTERQEAFDCLREQVTASREGQRSERDLRAQQSMADSAFVMLWITGGLGLLTFMLSGVATLLLRETLRETTRTADAAILANATAREIGEAQVRAYVACTVAEVTVSGSWVQAVIKFRNSGQSPALWCEVNSTFRLPVTRLDGRTHYEDSSPSESVDAAIQAGDQGSVLLIWFLGDFPGDSHERMRKAQAGLNLACRIRWMDVFRRVHEDYFQFHDIREENVSGPQENRTRYVTIKASSMPATTEHLREQHRA